MSENGLQIEQDLNFQRKEWIFQKIGAWFLGLFVLAAFLGVFGSGLISETEEISGNISVKTEKVSRMNDEFDIELTVKNPQTVNDTFSLVLNKEFLNGSKIEQIIPNPAAEISHNGEMTYQFIVPAGSPEFKSYIQIMHTTSGSKSLRIRTLNGDNVTINQTTLP